MATPKQVTEPATSVAANVTEPARPDTAPTRVYDPNKRVRVYDIVTGQLLGHTVPETHLDGRFPRLAEAPSNKKAGK